MTVENATYIDTLDATLPTSNDAKSEGDNHLRTIKSAVKLTFPNITGQVTPTQTELNYVSGVTSAIQPQINAKQATLVSGTNIKTVNGASVLGSGNLSVGTGDASGPASSVDNAIPRFDGATGKVLQGSGVLVDDSNNLSGVTTLNGNPIVAHVKSFGATGDGVTDDTTAIQNALASLTTGGVLDFDGVYNLGTYAGTGTDTKFTLSVSGVTLRFSERTKFLVKADAGLVQVFVFAGVSNIRTIGTLRVECNASTPYSIYGSYGAKAVVIYNANGSSCGDIHIDAIHLTRGSGALFVANPYAASNRVTGITVGSIETVDATYGFNPQNNGDDTKIGILRTYGAFRSYFVYGSENHKATVHAFDQYSTGTPVNVTEYSVAQGGSGVHTRNIDIDLLIDGGSPSCCLTVRHIGDGGASQIISGISVRCNATTLPAVGIELLNYDTSGGGISSTTFAATSKDISFENLKPGSTFTNAVSYSTCYWSTKPAIYWYGNGGISASDLNTIVADDRVKVWRNAYFTSSGGVGYDVGFGGTVTQATNKGTAVTLNKMCGQITMNAATLNAGALVNFTFNNNHIKSIADQVLVSIYQTVSGANYNVWAANNGIGQCFVFVKNISASNLSEAIVLNFTVINGSTT